MREVDFPRFGEIPTVFRGLLATLPGLLRAISSSVPARLVLVFDLYRPLADGEDGGNLFN